MRAHTAAARPSPATSTKSAPIQGQGEGDTCRNPAYLDGVWADVGRGVLLLKIGYSGFGACWAPPSTYHVVKLPR